MEPLQIEFTKINPCKDVKDSGPVLTDALSKHSQAVVTNNQEANNVAYVVVDKWFYTYSTSM